VLAPRPRPLALLALAAAASTALAACGAGPREASSKTVDSVNVDRGVVVGTDSSSGVRALNAFRPRAISSYETDLKQSLFGGDDQRKILPYLNGELPDAGTSELAYPGDRIGWLTRDISDIAATPSGVVGLYPAPFDTRFTAKRRLAVTRIQCASVQSAACTGTAKAFEKLGIQAGTSNLQDVSVSADVLRIYVGTWTELQEATKGNRLTPALAVQDKPAEQNGYGFQISADGKSVTIGAQFGKAAPTVSQYGAGTGVIFAVKDKVGATDWFVTGTDDAGAAAAAGALDETKLAGRVAAVVPPKS
jgi:hypothetical protein